MVSINRLIATTLWCCLAVNFSVHGMSIDLQGIVTINDSNSLETYLADDIKGPTSQDQVIVSPLKDAGIVLPLAKPIDEHLIDFIATVNEIKKSFNNEIAKKICAKQVRDIFPTENEFNAFFEKYPSFKIDNAKKRAIHDHYSNNTFLSFNDIIPNVNVGSSVHAIETLKIILDTDALGTRSVPGLSNDAKRGLLESMLIGTGCDRRAQLKDRLLPLFRHNNYNCILNHESQTFQKVKNIAAYKDKLLRYIQNVNATNGKTDANEAADMLMNLATLALYVNQTGLPVSLKVDEGELSNYRAIKLEDIKTHIRSFTPAAPNTLQTNIKEIEKEIESTPWHKNLLKNFLVGSAAGGVAIMALTKVPKISDYLNQKSSYMCAAALTGVASGLFTILKNHNLKQDLILQKTQKEEELKNKNDKINNNKTTLIQKIEELDQRIEQAKTKKAQEFGEMIRNAELEVIEDNLNTRHYRSR
jgi:hypothetical protein